MVKVVIKWAQSHACMSYAEPTHEARAEWKFTFVLPCKKEEDEVNVNKLDEVKVVVNLINQRNIQVTGKFVAAYMLYAAYESGILNPHLQYDRLQISRNRKNSSPNDKVRAWYCTV